MMLYHVVEFRDVMLLILIPTCSPTTSGGSHPSFQKVSNSTATNLFAAKKVESLIWSRLTRPRPEPSVGVGGGKSGLARKNISPSEYLSAPSEEMMKEKLVVKLATSRVLFFQRSMVSEYVARPQLSTAFWVSWMTEPKIVRLREIGVVE
jgi:hypothetical protein